MEQTEADLREIVAFKAGRAASLRARGLILQRLKEIELENVLQQWASRLAYSILLIITLFGLLAI
jgi:hypothetical protein